MSFESKANFANKWSYVSLTKKDGIWQRYEEDEKLLNLTIHRRQKLSLKMYGFYIREFWLFANAKIQIQFKTFKKFKV